MPGRSILVIACVCALDVGSVVWRALPLGAAGMPLPSGSDGVTVALSTVGTPAAGGSRPSSSPTSEARVPRPSSIGPSGGTIGARSVPRSDIATLEQQMDGRLLVPVFLPADCTPLPQFVGFQPETGTARLAYTCVSIAEETRTTNRGIVGPDASEAVSINGIPATYVDGIWTSVDGAEPTWVRGRNTQLMFERDGLLLRLTGRNLPKADLLRIAESLE